MEHFDLCGLCVNFGVLRVDNLSNAENAEPFAEVAERNTLDPFVVYE